MIDLIGVCVILESLIITGLIGLGFILVNERDKLKELKNDLS